MKTNVDNKLIVSLATDTNIYNKGKDIFLEDGIADVNSEKSTTGSIIKFIVNAEGAECGVSIRADHSGRVRGYGCSCEDSIDYMGACEHVVAALFHLADLNNFKGTRIKTDFITDELTSSFKKAFLSENGFLDNGRNKNFVGLEPTINFNASGKIYLTFKIGVKSDDVPLKNFYVIKNIGDFVKDVVEHEYYSYGKELAFTHNINKFDRTSRKIIKMLISEKANVDDATNIISKNNSLVRTNNFTANKELYVSKDGFDKLFDAYKEKSVSNYNFVTTMPNILFKGQVEDEKLLLYKSENEYYVFLGNHYGYVVFDKNIHRVDIDCGHCLKFIYDAFSKTQNEFISFKGEGINDFLSFILPILSKFKLINNNYIDDFYSVGYLPLHAKVYLDMDKLNLIARLQFNYGDTLINYDEPTEYDGYRDKLKEEEIIEILRYYGFVFDKEITLNKDDDIFEFYKSGIYSLNEVCEVFVTENFKQKQYKKEKAYTGISVNISGELLEMKIENSMYSTDELLEALSGYKIAKHYYRLKSGKFIDMDDENVKKTLTLLNTLKNDINDGEVIINKNKAFFINDLLSTGDFTFNKDKAFDELVDKINTIKDEKLVFDTYLGETLRHYQKEGVNWLKGLIDLGFGAILADEMGLGKTIEIIGLIEVDKDNIDKPYLIVCPTSLIYNWKNEFLRFAPDRIVELIVGTPMEREEKIKTIDGTKIYITTYDMVKRDIDIYKDCVFRYVILDEAQNIKNPITLSSQSVKMLKRENGIALTGTPIENSLKELWSIFDFIIPGYLYTINEFQNMYSVPIMNENDEERTKMLRYQISPFILRRFKKDVLLELPDKIETVLYANMTEEQNLAYEAFFKEAKGELMAYEEVNQMNIIRKLTRLRQISCHPKLFIDNYHGGSGKLDITMETVKNSIEEGHRVLLFSQFTSMLNIIMEKLDENNINYFYLDGKTKSKDRELMCARFNNGENNIFLISLKAGGTGLNLTGADVVIHYDPWWNPSVMNQASDRAHRFGQKKIVQVFNIIAKDTIEEKIYKLQLKKKELIDNVLTDEVQFINKLSKDELMNLFME